MELLVLRLASNRLAVAVARVPVGKGAAPVGADGDIVTDADDLDLGEGPVRALFLGHDIDVLDELVVVAAIRLYPQSGVNHQGTVVAGKSEGYGNGGRFIRAGGAIDRAEKKDVLGGDDAHAGIDQHGKLTEGTAPFPVGKDQADFAGEYGAP